MEKYEHKYTSSDKDVTELINTNRSGTNYKRLLMQIILIVAVVYGLYVFFTSKTNLLDYLSNDGKSTVTTIDQVQSAYIKDKSETLDFYLNKDITISGRYVDTLPSGEIFYIGSYGGNQSVYDAEVHVVHKKDAAKISKFGLGTAVKIKGKIIKLGDNIMVIRAESFDRED